VVSTVVCRPFAVAFEKSIPNQNPTTNTIPNRGYRPRMSSVHDYEAVRKDIVAQLKKPDYDDGSAGPVFVRLAWYVNPSFLFRGEVVNLVRGNWNPSDGSNQQRTFFANDALCEQALLRDL
jgi:hypothetical protein